MKLRWEKQPSQRGESWFAYSGQVLIGMVIERDDRTIGYTVQAVHMKWIGKGYGDVKSIASGKRAVERAWRRWLEAVGLLPILQNERRLETIVGCYSAASPHASVGSVQPAIRKTLDSGRKV